jgi:hypothetical protein
VTTWQAIATVPVTGIFPLLVLLALAAGVLAFRLLLRTRRR